mmetsp:Transcript_19954/g.44294  ORF Transcript_19954/g.44294 Transcript_19954/m.44294 type:complete len:300 (-) Transcript_19954:610-1509(-)
MGGQQSCCCAENEAGEHRFTPGMRPDALGAIPAISGQKDDDSDAEFLGAAVDKKIDKIWRGDPNNPEPSGRDEHRRLKMGLTETEKRLPDGSVYKGEVDASGQKHGEGTLTTTSGAVYSGSFRDDKKEGFGKCTSPSKTSKGSLGSVYEGHWSGDAQHGRGTIKWADGSTFDGTFARGKKNGDGRFSWADGSTFTGQFRDNEMNGRGSYKWSDGISYTGDWVNNVMQGHGDMSWPDGRQYVGQFRSGLSHGEGNMSWPDGRSYAGQWESGKQHGVGLLSQPGGESSKTQWNRGEWVSNM